MTSSTQSSNIEATDSNDASNQVLVNVDVFDESDDSTTKDFVDDFLGTEIIILLRRLIFFIEDHAGDILRIAIVGWVVIFIALSSQIVLLELLTMPSMGIFAACLANCIPVGGGIIYIPALSLAGMNIKLGAAFSVATMSIGNGVFGFLNWLRRDRSLFIWKGVLFALIPTWIGYLLGELIVPDPGPWIVHKAFGVVCFLLSGFVYYIISKGGLAQAFEIESEKAGFAPEVDSLTISGNLKHCIIFLLYFLTLVFCPFSLLAFSGKLGILFSCISRYRGLFCPSYRNRTGTYRIYWAVLLRFYSNQHLSFSIVTKDE
jgi:uncharacterized membrane protein YfcA